VNILAHDVRIYILVPEKIGRSNDENTLQQRPVPHLGDVLHDGPSWLAVYNSHAGVRELFQALLATTCAVCWDY
jgi:hypothetical protein